MISQMARETCGEIKLKSPGKLFGNKEMRILMLGLDAAGKTSESGLPFTYARRDLQCRVILIEGLSGAVRSTRVKAQTAVHVAIVTCAESMFDVKYATGLPG